MGKVYRRRRRLAANIFKRADKLEALTESPQCTDDPAWLKVGIDAMRKFATRRQKARVRNIENHRKAARREKTTLS
jgi:hypothetical protein